MKTTAETRGVKTTVELPEELRKAAKRRAIDDDSDLRSVVIAALTQYLNAGKKKGGK